MMRRRDRCGDFVECREVPGLMLPRQVENEGPFFRLYPEGHIEPFDGVTIPSPDILSDNDTDLNRNFPWSWLPEPEQDGAGAYPTSEPEARAVVEFTSEHPEIFAWLNLHTFGGVYIRPLGHAPDKKMNAMDLAVFRQIEAWGEELTGYPMVSGYEEFLYRPEKPLHGDLTDWAYHVRGCVAYVCELWDLFRQLGIPRRQPFVDHYTHLSRAELLRLGRWDAEHNRGRIFRPWKPFRHSQLGDVETGGVDIRVGLSNPPYEKLGDICRTQSAMFLRVAAMLPRVTLEALRVEPVAPNIWRVEVCVSNLGYLPTFGLASAKDRPFNEPLQAAVTCEGCQLVTGSAARQDVGHLEGWGRGLYAGFTVPFHQRSLGSTHQRVLHWVVRGKGRLLVRVGSCRVGWQTRDISIG
jgi:hypothetical protein